MKRILALVLALTMALALGAVPVLGAVEFEPIVLADNDILAVTVTGYDPAGGNGPAFEVLLENKTDQPLSFGTDGLAVNGVMTNMGMDETVEANSEMNSQLILFLSAKEMEEKGIRYVKDVQVKLYALVPEGDLYAEVYNEVLSWSVPGTGDGGPAVEEPAQDSGFAPIEVLSGDVSIVIHDVFYSQDDMLRLGFTVKNETDHTVHLRSADVKLNGTACDPSWWALVLPGAMSINYCIWRIEDLQAAGIDTVETVDFGLTVTDSEARQTLDEPRFTLDMNSLASAAEPAPTEEPAEEPTPTEAPVEETGAAFTEEQFDEDLETSDPITLSAGGETVVAVLPEGPFFEQFDQQSNVLTMLDYSRDRGVGMGRAYLGLENEDDPAAWVSETVSYNVGIKQETASEGETIEATEPVTETINDMPVTWARITKGSVNLFGQQTQQVSYYAAAPVGQLLVTAEVVYTFLPDSGVAMDDSIVTAIFEGIFTGEDAAEAAAAKAAEDAEPEEFVVLGEENGALMAATGFEPDGNSASLELYLQNDTDSTVLFALQDVTVNGVYYDPIWGTEVEPQSSQQSTVKWNAGTYTMAAQFLPDLADMAEDIAGIERFETIEMTVSAQVKDTEEYLFAVRLSLDVADEYE